MLPKPRADLTPNTADFERFPLVKPTGFREYDARWLFGKEINLMGIQALGMGLGTLISDLGAKQEIVTGHDFRGYSASIKYALISGLLASGCKVHDIGLCMTPMAYFAQFDLDVPCVAMVTASHNDNGWTGVKMGANRPLSVKGPGTLALSVGPAGASRCSRSRVTRSHSSKAALSQVKPSNRSPWYTSSACAGWSSSKWARNRATSSWCWLARLNWIVLRVTSRQGCSSSSLSPSTWRSW